MNTMQCAVTSPAATEWMGRQGFHMARQSNQVTVRSFLPWSGVAAVSFAAAGMWMTNPAIELNVHFDTVHTNPVISLPGENVNWLDEENGELASFLSFMGAQIDAHADLIVPADEAQLDRLASLLANVKV